MTEISTIDDAEVYILDHEKCGKCKDIYYIAGNFFCDGTGTPIEMPKYVHRNPTCPLAYLKEENNNSTITDSELLKEIELFRKVFK